MTDRTNATTFYEWEIVAVTPLPAGWVNVYSDPDGYLYAVAAPALLMEKAETWVRAWDAGTNDDGTTRRHVERLPRIPAITRVAYACSNLGELSAADEAANYVASMTAAEFAQMQMPPRLPPGSNNEERGLTTMTEHNIDDLGRMVGDYQRPPKDIVNAGLTADALIELDRHAGQSARYKVNELPDDADTLGPAEHLSSGRLVIPASVVHKLGLTPADLPNTHVYDDSKERS